MINVGDKVKILDVGGELANAKEHLQYFAEMELNPNNYCFQLTQEGLCGKIGTVIKIDLKEEIYFIQFEDGLFIAMFYEDIYHLNETGTFYIGKVD